MRAGGGVRSVAERVYACLTRLYPGAFRNEYGAEMLQTFSEWHRSRRRDPLGVLGFWMSVLLDLGRSLPREWVVELRNWKTEAGTGGPDRPSYLTAALAAAAVLTIYVLTLAPTTAFWDAGEYITVAHVLGIPHPPGSPLFVLLARAWELLLTPLDLSVAVRINLLSAVLSASAHGLWYLVAERALATWTDVPFVRRVGAAAGVVLSATAFTVWNQSNVNEKVYPIALFTTALVSWLLLRWRDTGRNPKDLILIVFLVGLSATNHLMGVLVVPALVVFWLLVDRGALLRPQLWGTAVPVLALALSVHFFLPIRAAERPLISEGEPTCMSATGAALSVYSWGSAGCEDLSAVLTREQYGKPSILSDPTDSRRPRGSELLAAQFGNYAQYFNWQWARSIAGTEARVGGPRVGFTLAFLLLGLLGFRAHREGDRAGAAYLGTLFLTLSVGLVLYLNFRYGYSIARDRFPAAEMHEVRERDYFFLIGFSVWGLWAGMGLAALWRRAADGLRGRIGRPHLAAAPLLGVALLPLLLNWGWASRAEDYTARDWAYNLLNSVEPYGVLFTNGDNDTFPLWYLQEVEGVRKDVTVVVQSYLALPWYVKQLRALTMPCPAGVNPAEDPSRILCQRPFDPAGLPHALVEAGWTRSIEPPRDSIVPLTDEEIDRIAGEYVVAQEPLVLRAGGIEGQVEVGTPLLPSDLFAAAVLRGTMGERPIHLMPGSPVATTLGLSDYTVRQGLVWRLRERPAGDTGGDAVVALPTGTLSRMDGAAIDLPLTDTLTEEVYIRRGRILDPKAPWVDDAASNIPMQYVLMHYVAAEAHTLRGAREAAERHLRQAHWWQAVIDG